MALATAPTTPDRRGQSQTFRRSFTAPPRATKQSLPLTEAEKQGAETLYVHPHGKIVQFTSSATAVRRHSSDTGPEAQDEPVGTLPWASITERTVAAGALQIYRVLGSVAFLNSGKILQPLLAKSQCWCVDGVSKFVLRVRPNTYYRIELPSETPDEEQSVEEMKKALESILQYEKTPCPFKRGFTVDLPEPPSTPIRKIPWKPKVSAHSEVEEISEESEPPEITDKDVPKEDIPQDIGLFHEPLRQPKRTTDEEKTVTPSKSELKSPSVAERKADIEASEADNQQGNSERDEVDEPQQLKTPTRPRQLRTGRTVTAPPELSLRTTPPSIWSQDSAASTTGRTRESSNVSSVDSFHSFHSPISPLPPSPPLSDSSPDILVNHRIRGHKRDASDATVTANQNELWDLTEASGDNDTEYHSPPDQPRAATLIQEAVSEDITQPSSELDASEPKVRLRNTRRMRQRTISPMPSSSNLYAPLSPRAHMTGHHLTTAILQRTCSLLLGPPVQLVALMLRIAAKITRGVFHGTAYGVNNEGQRIPCSWDFSDGSGDDEDEQGIDGDDEDDYGISLGKTVSDKQVRSRDHGASWEID